MAKKMKECWICKRTAQELKNIKDGAEEGRMFDVSLFSPIDNAWICCTCEALAFYTIDESYGGDIVTNEELNPILKKMEKDIQEKYEELASWINHILEETGIE